MNRPISGLNFHYFNKFYPVFVICVWPDTHIYLSLYLSSVVPFLQNQTYNNAISETPYDL